VKYPSQLTPWFPGDVKPSRKGIYIRKNHLDQQFYSKWNGKFWVAYASHLFVAEKFTEASLYQNWEWRGLAQDPSKGSTP
jgi:hypothetical protein